MRNCTQCGKCCLKYGGGGLGGATAEDLQMWKTRPDIMHYIDESLPDLWVSPVTGEEMFRCPFLRKRPNVEKYNCRIHDARPFVCRDYPEDVEQMERDGCEMFEECDKGKSPGQLAKELAKVRNKTK